MFADGSATISCRDIAEFINEAGGLSFQQISGAGKKSRVHTSTVTCSVLMDCQAEVATPYDLREDCHFTYTAFSGTGAGGQHRNRKQCCIKMTHVPTGLTQKAEGRVKHENIDLARETLIAMLDEAKRNHTHVTMNNVRSDQVGDGSRSSKFRTIRFQDDLVNDSRTGRTMSAKAFMKGQIDRLW